MIHARRSRTMHSITTTSTKKVSQTTQCPATSTVCHSPCGCDNDSASNGRTASAATMIGVRKRASQTAARGSAIGEGATPDTLALRLVQQRLGPDRITALQLVAALVAFMWALEAVDYVAPGRPLDAYGIHPRSGAGLAEVVSAPFLHVGFGHLISNTVPFAAMGAAIALGGLARVALVTAIVGVVSGLGVWLIAPSNEVHLGASGLVFGYATYLVARGILSRSIVELAVGVVVVAIWGIGLLEGLLPQERISWQAHLFGAIGGVVAAYYLAGKREPAAAAAPI